MELYKEKQPYWGPNLLRSVYLRCDLPEFRWAEFMARIEEKIDMYWLVRVKQDERPR
jgi:hypothetical protein